MDGEVYATMLKLYGESRPAEILPIERAADDEFLAVLLAGRNAVMAERAARLLRAGGAFVAVGALHLAGKDGLIERLRAAGLAVTQAW